MSDHMTDAQAADLADMIALLAGTRTWITGAEIAQRLGFLLRTTGKPNIRYVADLRRQARGKIISTRKPPYGYKLMRHATQQEFDRYQAMLHATISEIQDTSRRAYIEWNHGHKRVEANGQRVML